MIKYTNKWINMDGEIVQSETRPAGYGWSPLYADSRIKGCKITPYLRADGGSLEWRNAANAAMGKQANANFNK